MSDQQLSTKETYTNRYGDIYTFTLLENGNIQWEGKFEYCRLGWPNDYTEAYEKYKHSKVGKAKTLEEFIDEMHEQFYDDDQHFLGYSLTSELFGEFVKPDVSRINMVDPSGGPFLTQGMKVLGKTIKEFKSTGNGFTIITE